MVGRSGWRHSLTCSEVKHQVMLLVPGRVTTLVYSDKLLPHNTHTHVSNRILPHTKKKSRTNNLRC